MSNNRPIYTEINLVKPERVLKKEVISVYDEDAYQNAQLENDRIENKLNNDRHRLDQFRRLVNERIRSYKMAQQIQSEYEEMKKLEKINRIEKLKKTIDNQRVKSYVKQKKISQEQKAKIPLILRSNNKEQKPAQKPMSAPIVSQQNTIVDKDNYDEWRRQRISYIRSAYGQFERNKSKISLNKNRQSASFHSHNKQKCFNITKNSNKSSNLNILDQITNNLFDMNLSNNNVFNSTIQSNKEHYKDVDREEDVSIGVKKNNHAKSTEEPPSFLSSSCGSNNSMRKYLKYLKQLLKEKGNTIILPPLCQCNLGSSCTNTIKTNSRNKNLFDTNDWENCANNCIFYNNPKEYAKVLLDLIGGDRERLEKFQNYRDSSLIQN